MFRGAVFFRTRCICRQSHSYSPLKLLDEMRRHLAGTLVWSQVTPLYRGPGPHGKGGLGVGTTVHSDAAYLQISLALVKTCQRISN